MRKSKKIVIAKVPESNIITFFEGKQVPHINLLQNAADYCIAKGLQIMDSILDSNDVGIDDKIKAFDAIVKCAKYIELRQENIKKSNQVFIDMEELKIVDNDGYEI